MLEDINDITDWAGLSPSISSAQGSRDSAKDKEGGLGSSTGSYSSYPQKYLASSDDVDGDYSERHIDLDELGKSLILQLPNITNHY